jgi:hypothetical protein
MTSRPTNSRASIFALRFGVTAALLTCLGQTVTANPGVASSQEASSQRSVERYVLAGADGASLYNLPDPKGQVVLDVAAGTPLAVLGSKSEGRYLKVMAPGGLKVWVFGKYLKESERKGWVELTGSYVQMRPMPRSQNSYPLGQLDKGERLLFLQRNDPSKPLAEDWVQVYSPGDTAAYVLAARTAAVPAGQDGAKLWSGAADVAMVERASGTVAPIVEAGATPGERTTPEPTIEQEPKSQEAPADVFAAMREADALMDGEMQKPAPDFLGMIAAYETVLAMGPDAPTRHLVERRMNEISLARELSELKQQAASEKAQRERELRELRARIDRLSTERDPLWGRFVARGWLESEVVKGQRVYSIRFGSERVAEVRCLSGRYDLDQYVDFELGLRGMSIASSSTALDALPVIDIERIEVISARLKR